MASFSLYFVLLKSIFLQKKLVPKEYIKKESGLVQPYVDLSGSVGAVEM